MWLFHAEPKQIRYLLNKYKLKSLDIQFTDITYDRLNNYVDNLVNSTGIIIDNFKNENYKHNRKILQITKSYLMILEVINISIDQKNALLEKYLLLLEILGETYFRNYDFLYNFLNSSKEVSVSNLEKIISLLTLDNLQSSNVFSLAIKLYIEKKIKPQF